MYLDPKLESGYRSLFELMRMKGHKYLTEFERDYQITFNHDQHGRFYNCKRKQNVKEGI